MSVVVPAFNAEDFLKPTLESIRNQSLSNFECLVVDDGSSDGTMEIIKEFRALDSRFKVVPHRSNAGLSAARNSGLRAASAPFVTFIDSDDLMIKDGLLLRATALNQEDSPFCCGSYGGSITIAEDATIAPPGQPRKLQDVSYLSALGRCPFNANQPMFRVEAIRHVGGFNEELRQAEDYDTWIRMLRCGYFFKAVNFDCVTYRNRRNSMVRSNPMGHLNTSNALLKSCHEELPIGILPPGPSNFTKPISEYLRQNHSINRTGEFIGIALAQNNIEIDQLAEYFCETIPDYFLLNKDSQNLETRLKQGIKRHGAADESVEDRLSDLILEISKRSKNMNGNSPKVNEFPYLKTVENRVWNTKAQLDIDVVFFVHKAYHAWTVALAKDALIETNVKYACVDLSPNWKDGGNKQAAERYGLELIGMSQFILGSYRPRLLVAFNDWDPATRPIFMAARSAGIKTASIVEGIQDYLDIDTNRSRYPYQASDSVMLPGKFDAKYFSEGTELNVVGVHRIHHLVAQPKKEPRLVDGKKIALINSNFSFNVLTHERDNWLEAAVEAALQAGFHPCISRHPDDRGESFTEFVDERDFYEILEDSTVTIQRFASGILEAIARQKVVFYFRPSSEKIDKFTDPMKVFPVLDDKETLISELKNYKFWQKAVKKNGNKFLELHAGELGVDVGTATAQTLKKIMGPKPDEKMHMAFCRKMREIDIETRGLTTRKPLFDNLDKKSIAKEWLRLSEHSRIGPVNIIKKSSIMPMSINPAMVTHGSIWRFRIFLDRILAKLYHWCMARHSMRRPIQKLADMYNQYLKPR